MDATMILAAWRSVPRKIRYGTSASALLIFSTR
jgi:hypothetical protein